MEARKGKLRHLWTRRFALDKEATGDNWAICKRCGVPLKKDKSNYKEACREAKKPKA